MWQVTLRQNAVPACENQLYTSDYSFATEQNQNYIDIERLKNDTVKMH